MAALFACRLNELSELYGHAVVCARGACLWVVYGEQIHETPPLGNSSVAGVGFGLAWSGGRGVEDARVRLKSNETVAPPRARRLPFRSATIRFNQEPYPLLKEARKENKKLVS